MSNVSTQPKPAVTSNDIILGQARVVPAPDDYVPLTPDLLLLFCQTRLREMDSAIETKMQGQKDLVNTQKEIQDIQTALKTPTTGASDVDAFNDPEAIKTISAQIDASIERARTAGPPELVKALEAVKAKLNFGDSRVTKDEMKEMTSLLDNASSTCRSGAEVSMIELQSLVSARATQLQLTTGMMNGINEGSKAIAGNIGR